MAKKTIIFLIGAFIMMLLFIGPFSKLRELNMKNQVLMEEIEHLRKVNKALKKEARRLEGDLEYIEKRAREKTGAVKEGEIIYKIAPEEE